MEPRAERKRVRAKRAGAFHHGDLREALIAAATQTVERDGHGALSLRPLAERLGVSQPALYRHFDDKDALLAEIAVRSGQTLQDAMARAMATERDGFVALRAGARAYVRWALAHPHLFRLFSSRIPSEQRAGPRPPLPREHYHRGMAGIVPLEDPMLADAFRLSWAVVHGLATLVVERVFQLVDTDAQRLATADAAIDCYAELLRAKWPASP